MTRYTLDQLATASTYAADEALATLARRVAEAATQIDLPTGERKRLALAGGMAEAVHQAVTAACDAARELAADRAAMASITLPGWTIAIGETHADFSGPRDESINAALRRHGVWVAASRVWRLPVSKGRTLVRSLKRQAGPAATAAREGKAQATRLADLTRWLGYVEQAVREGRVYERGLAECRARTIADFADLAARLDAALAQARTLGAERAARIAAERAQHDSEYAAERAARAEASRRRTLFILGQAPTIGRVYRLRGEAVVYTGSGKNFRVTEDDPAVWGSHLLGHEGEPCAYYYHRPATEAEAAELALIERAAQ